MHARTSLALFALALAAAARPGPVAAAPPAPTSETAASTAHALLARFARIPGLSARYREEKRMALLIEPLVSEGRLYYARPGAMVRHQDRPEPATVLLDGDRLATASGGRRDTLDLSKQPVVRMFVDTVRSVLAGDEARLSALYTITFEPREGGGWRLRLVPRADPLRRILDHMMIEGHDVVLEVLEIVERGGDTTRMTFTDVDPHRAFTQEERARIFRLP